MTAPWSIMTIASGFIGCVSHVIRSGTVQCLMLPKKTSPVRLNGKGPRVVELIPGL